MIMQYHWVQPRMSTFINRIYLIGPYHLLDIGSRNLTFFYQTTATERPKWTRHSTSGWSSSDMQPSCNTLFKRC